MTQQFVDQRVHLLTLQNTLNTGQRVGVMVGHQAISQCFKASEKVEHATSNAFMF